MGAKDGCKFVTDDYSIAEHTAVTWERFTEMFRVEFIPVVECERLAHEFLSLKQKIETVTEITKMFHDRDLFFLEHVSRSRPV